MSRRVPCPVIAIVGAGFSGTMAATHLLREARSPLRVVLIERAETAGAGIAYREQSDRHLLNVRAEGMSAFPDQPGHFLRWLADYRGDEALVNPAAFLPRRLYGHYLRDVLATAADQAPRDPGAAQGCRPRRAERAALTESESSGHAPAILP